MKYYKDIREGKCFFSLPIFRKNIFTHYAEENLFI